MQELWSQSRPPLVSISKSICVFYAPLSAKTVANTSSTVGNMGNEIFMMGKGARLLYTTILYYHSPTSLVLTMTKNLLHGETRTTLNHSLNLPV
jgi:hypothetical protein